MKPRNPRPSGRGSKVLLDSEAFSSTINALVTPVSAFSNTAPLSPRRGKWPPHTRALVDIVSTLRQRTSKTRCQPVCGR